MGAVRSAADVALWIALPRLAYRMLLRGWYGMPLPRLVSDAAAAAYGNRIGRAVPAELRAALPACIPKRGAYKFISSTYSPPLNRSTANRMRRSSTNTSLIWIAPLGDSFGAPATK